MVLFNYNFLLISASFICAGTTGLLLLKNMHFSGKQLIAFLFLVIITALSGARLYLVILHWGFFVHHPVDILKIWKGGLVYWGAILGGLAGIIVFCGAIKWKCGIGQILDLVALSIPIPHIIGRVGCLLGGCCFGKPTELPWGITYPAGYRIMQIENLVGISLHPTQVYDMVSEAVCLAVSIILQRKKTGSGMLFATYLLLYGIFRFSTEFFRYDVRHGIKIASIFFLTHNQILCLAFIFFGVAFIVYRSRPRFSKKLLIM